MFTGLIQQQGRVILNRARQSAQSANELRIAAEIENPAEGESIAVNGVCLTLLPGFERGLTFDVSPETLSRTTLGKLQSGDSVNLERAMSAQSRLGGHYVSGHVDTTVCLRSTQVIDNCLELIVDDFEPDHFLYLLPKGSITLEGVSLTINAVNAPWIQLLIVPHTLEKTTLGEKKPGQRLNVEFDYLARTVLHQLNILKILRAGTNCGV